MWPLDIETITIMVPSGSSSFGATSHLGEHAVAYVGQIRRNQRLQAVARVRRQRIPKLEAFVVQLAHVSFRQVGECPGCSDVASSASQTEFPFCTKAPRS